MKEKNFLEEKVNILPKKPLNVMLCKLGFRVFHKPQFSKPGHNLRKM